MNAEPWHVSPLEQCEECGTCVPCNPSPCDHRPICDECFPAHCRECSDAVEDDRRAEVAYDIAREK